jgi:hypothetical protein
VKPQTQTVTTRSREDLPRFVNRENFVFTEYIAVFSELLMSDTWQHLVDQECDVRFSP